jgi:hypothetical protein
VVSVHGEMFANMAIYRRRIDRSVTRTTESARKILIRHLTSRYLLSVNKGPESPVARAPACVTERCQTRDLTCAHAEEEMS